MVNPIPTAIFTSIIAVSLVATAGVESYALKAKEAAENPPQVIGREYCVQCHNTPTMLLKMKQKEGNCHFVFKKGDPIEAAYAASLKKSNVKSRAKLASAYPKTAAKTW